MSFVQLLDFFGYKTINQLQGQRIKCRTQTSHIGTQLKMLNPYPGRSWFLLTATLVHSFANFPGHLQVLHKSTGLKNKDSDLEMLELSLWTKTS